MAAVPIPASLTVMQQTVDARVHISEPRSDRNDNDDACPSCKHLAHGSVLTAHIIARSVVQACDSCRLTMLESEHVF